MLKEKSTFQFGLGKYSGTAGFAGCATERITKRVIERVTGGIQGKYREQFSPVKKLHARCACIRDQIVNLEENKFRASQE